MYNYEGLNTYFSVSQDIEEVKDIFTVVEIPNVTSVEKNGSMLIHWADLGRRVGLNRVKLIFFITFYDFLSLSHNFYMGVHPIFYNYINK